MLAAFVALMILGGAAFLVTVGRRWFERRAMEQEPVSLPVARGRHHMHYCTGCDRQWEHAGVSHKCTRSWATPCPRCAAAANRR
jgi:hypothetical protein